MTPKRKPPNASIGKRRGVKNKLTRDVDHAMALASQPGTHQERADRVMAWLREIAKRNPARAAETFVGLLRRVMPRPRRVREIEQTDSA